MTDLSQIDPPSSAPPPITLRALFIAWLQIGLQSFGGGQSTLGLIQRILAAQNGWITTADFAQANAMATMAPGINLLAITILIGQQLGGTLGIAASLAGLLIPSVVVTVLMTAGYAEIRGNLVVQHAFHAIVPATVGIGSLTAWSMAQAFIQPSRAIVNRLEIVSSVAIIVLSFILMWLHVPVPAILLGGGITLALIHSAVAKQDHKQLKVDPE